jgi:hypothetical protein
MMVTDMNKNLYRLAGFMALIFTFIQGQDEYVWEQLFNGEDLEGWNFHMRGQEYNVDPWNTLKVSDGILHVDYSEYENFDQRYLHFGRDDVFSHFILGVEYRFIGDQIPGGNPYEFRNSGILFHSQAMSELEIETRFPTAIEAQTLVRGGGGEREDVIPSAPGEDPIATLNLCPINTSTREGHNCNTSESHIVIENTDIWIRAEITVRGDSIGIFVLNGDTLGVWHDFRLGGTGEPLSEGTLSFQAESHPIDFRKIEIVNLAGCMDDSATNYKDYYVVHDEDACDYTVNVNDAKVTQGEIQFDHFGVFVYGSGLVKVEVYDVNGRRVMSEQGVNFLNRSFIDLGPGLYLIRAHAGEKKVTGNFIRL